MLRTYDPLTLTASQEPLSGTGNIILIEATNKKYKGKVTYLKVAKDVP